MAFKPLPAKLIFIIGALVLAGCEKEETPETKQPPAVSDSATPAVAVPASPAPAPQVPEAPETMEEKSPSEAATEPPAQAEEPGQAEVLLKDAEQAGWEIREDPDGSTLILPPR
ncbi:MAG: hypothetical protein ABFS23_06165 [Pseudomonadota bacterium]